MQQLLKVNLRRLLIIFSAFVAMVLVSSFYVSRIVNHQIRLLGEEMLDTMQAEVSADLAESELFFANLAQTVESMLANQRSNEAILTFLTEINGYYASDHSPLSNFMKVYAHLRGEFLDGSGWVPYEGYEAPQRPWHIGALQTKGVFFSEPYIDAETGTTVISFSQQMTDARGEFAGVLAIDLNLRRLTEYVSGQQLVDGGYGFLVSDGNHFIAHANEALVGKSLEDFDNYDSLRQVLSEGQEAVAIQIVDLDGTPSIIFSRTLFNGWQLGTISPRSAYYRQVSTMVSVLSILGLVLFSLLSVILLRSSWQELRSEAASKSKSNFLASMSHEIRTPMNAIVGLTGIAQKTEDPQKIKQYLMKIDAASDHLLSVINDILDMSKIEAGKMELHEEEFLLEPSLLQSINVLSYKFEEREQHFTLSIAPDVPASIIADEKCLAHIITNLLSNANKFTPPRGHIGLSVRTEALYEDHCTLRVDVTDDGIGISPDQQAKLFRAFSQADKSISRQYGGTGLGLLISKNMTEMMGGHIWVTSEEGHGSQFSFTFPAGIGTLTSEKRAKAESPLQAPDFAGKRLLLVDDLEINREIITEMLRDTGIQIRCAKDGQEAVDHFASDPGGYDLILMDVQMPVLNGLDATRGIRAMDLENSGHIPIIAMTADIFQEDIDRCFAAGMNGHLGKPIRETDLYRILRQYLP